MCPILSFRQNYFILCKPAHIIQIYQKTRMRFAKSYLIQFLLPILQLSLHFIPGILCAYVHTTPLILNHNNVCFPTDNRLSILHNCDFGIRIPIRHQRISQIPLDSIRQRCFFDIPKHLKVHRIIQILLRK